MEFGEVILPAGVAMRIDVHQAYWDIATHRGENGIGDGMVAAHTQRLNASITHLVIEGGNILDTVFEAEATSEGHITDIGYPGDGARCYAQLMIIGPDPLNLTHRPRTETCPRTVCHTEIHRDANECNIKITEFLLVWR